MKKIIFITNLNVLGGTENNLVSIVSHPEFNSSFKSVIFTGRSPHPSIGKSLSHSNIKTIEFTRFANISVPRFFRNHVFEKHLKTVNPDIVVFWNHVSRSGQLPICKKHNINTVFFERGTSWANHDPLKMSHFLSTVDHVLSNSSAGRQILSARWGFKGKCSVLPNAVRPEIKAKAFQVKEFSQNYPLHIGVAARLVAYKGVASVILAAHELKNTGLQIQLEIAGDGPEKNTLQRLCESYDVRANFRGSIRDMSSFYQKVDVLVCPSLREPFGTVVIEAQAMGCPVICSAVDGLPEIVKDGVTGYTLEPAWETEEYLRYVNSRREMPELVFSPGKNKLVRPMALLPADIAECLYGLIENPEKLNGMSKAARNFARDNYDFGKYVIKLKKLFTFYCQSVRSS